MVVSGIEQSTIPCDGCAVPFSPEKLIPVGDGTLRVCVTCHPIAVATLLTPDSAAKSAAA